MQNDPKFVKDSNSTLKFLTFQLSNVRELDTIKYAFEAYTEKLVAECIENKETREWALGNTYPRAVEQAKKELGESSGGKYLEREPWFRNSKVQETVAESEG